MKKILLSLVAIATLSLSSFGQAPEGFKYQAVVRDAGNTILNNQAVGMRLTVQQGSIGGTAVYAETFAATTNAYGLINLEIGTGTTTDDFATIDWSNGPYFMETAVDFLGGMTWVVMGTSQLMSVPYALYAKTAENTVNDLVDDADSDPTNEIELPATGTTNDVLTWNGAAWVSQINTDTDPTNELQTLSVSAVGDTLHLQNGGFVIIPGISLANIPLLAIGDSYQGGIIFYLDGLGGGLIAAPTDQNADDWGCNGTLITGADGTAVGTGNQNTIDIEVGCPAVGTAADVCANLTLNSYSDWFLPSKDELNLMYQNIGQGNALGLGNIGGFADNLYWSSSEIDLGTAWLQNFGPGGGGGGQYNGRVMRAARAF